VDEALLASKLLGGQIRVVQRRFDGLPKGWQTDYPMIGLVRAGVALTTGEFDLSTRARDEVEQELALEGARKRDRITRFVL
jgi:hypothetical protein